MPCAKTSKETALQWSVDTRLEMRRRHVRSDLFRVPVPAAHGTLTAWWHDRLCEPVIFASRWWCRCWWRRWWHLHFLICHGLLVRALGAADAGLTRVP